MARIVPIEPGARGEDAANLIAAMLTLLGRDAIAISGTDRAVVMAQMIQERTAKSFGAGTKRVVELFQRAHQLEPTGRVDERTAKVLNDLLDLVDGPGGNGARGAVQQFAVAGQVRLESGPPVAGRRVRASHKSERAAVHLGEATTDAEGRYTIRYEPLSGVEAIRLRIAVLDDEGRVLREVDGPAAAKALETVDVTLPAAAPQAAAGRVDGRIVLEHGQPAENVTIRLYRREFGGKATLLDEKKTAAQGVYSLAYPRDTTAAVEIRAVNAAGAEVALSTTFFPDAEKTTANFIAPAEIKPLAPEFARLSSDLAREIGAFDKLATAREDATQRDLSMLNRTTGWDARLLALASNAARLTADPELRLAPPVAYALLRAGLPADKTELAQASPDAIRRALEVSRTAGIVAMTDDEIKAATAQFTRAATEIALNAVPAGSTSSYRRILESSGVAAPALQKFTPILLQHRGEGAELWKKAKDAGVSDADIRALQQHGKLAFLTTNNVPLVEKLRGAGVTTPEALVTNDFDRAEKWKTQIRGLHANDAELQKLIPAAYGGATLDERIDAYANDMARKVRVSYPTQVVSRMIARDDADTMRLGAARQGTRAFLDAAAGKGFKLGSTPVDTFLRDNPGVLPAAGATETRQSLKTLQRVYQMTPSDEAMKTLLELGFTSASQIAKMSRDVFIDRYAPKFRTPDEARLVYDKAVQIDSVTYNLFSIARQMDSATPLTATASSPEAKKAAKDALVKQYPTMESLFGSLDYGECEHCQSVLSPAAYLVDLLQFIDPDSFTWDNFLQDWRNKHNGQEFTAKYKKPYDALIARRPDLPHIPLTCENTNVALPYIDIVNEILEYYVAKNQLEPAAAKDTGSATSAELIAEPQHVLSEAYNALLAARYPLGLPFDLWIETVRRFTEHFEIPLWRILDVFRPGDELFAPGRIYDRAGVYAESLGLSPTEWTMFTDPNALASWFRLYGFDNAAAATQVAVDASGQRIDLNSAKALSRRLGITYRQLIDLLRTNFVNPKLQALVPLEKSRLTVKDALFREKHKGLLVQAEATLSVEDRKKRDEVLAFDARLDETSAAYPGFNARQWFSAAVAANELDGVLVLADPDAGANFDLTTLRYANGNAADGIAFLRINLFVRLWRKLGWSMAEVDRALSVFIPRNTPFDAANLAQSPLRTALIYLAHLVQLEQSLPVGKNARPKLLTFWSAMDSSSPSSLYAQLFLTRSMLKRDPSFDHPRGLYLSAANVLLKDHLSAVRAAIGLTADEIAAIVARKPGQTMATAPLSMDNVTLLYRHQVLAKALKLPIRDLLALIDISGIDPFQPIGAAPIADASGDVLLNGTMRFVELARQVREAGFKIEDLDYLLRHTFDPNGPYALVADGTPALILTLADGIRAIRAENAVPADPGGISDDVLRQKLGLVLPADVVERFLAMLNGSVEVTVTRTGVAPANQLDPAAFVDEPSVRQVRYNAARQEQSLTFRGVLFDAQKAALQGTFPSPVFASLLADVQTEGRAFFQKHLQKQPPNVRPIAGFLDAADFDLLFAPAPAPPNDADEQTRQRLAQERIRQQKQRLAEAFLPYLQRKLVGTFVVQTLAAQSGTDLALTEALVTEKQIAGGATPLVDAFTATDASGVTGAFFASNDATGAALATGLLDDATTAVPLAPAATRSARMSGYLRVPSTGAYRFFVSLGKAGAEAELRFDHLAAPLIRKTAAIDGEEVSEFTELKAGVPYRFTLELRNLGTGSARMQVQGETLPKDRLSQLTLYAQSAIDAGARAALLLDKVVRILRILTLSEREVRYLTSHAGDFAGLDLSKLPTSGNVAAATARTLFSQLLRLMAYARLRRDLTGGTDELISVFETSAVDVDDAYPLLASLTRREEGRIRETAERLFAAPRFVDEVDLGRVWEALQLVERFGVPLQAIAGARGVAPAQATGWITIVNPAATPEQRFGIARDLKETLRARFDAEAWQQIAQPIFDKLRRAQRDALSAHVMHKRGFARIEQLYEYFLIDPAMEPVVLTSRIRLASAAVQLFIGRALLNLEKDVHPSSIDSVQWEWMKRYRVWEANRKIFLFPENWLEPEFRDDRTHLYTELESKLLQGDVSRDQVNEACFTYLQKLEEIHRLEIVAMHCENDPAPAKNKLHVFARTYGDSPKYFYRRYEGGMWTPWEPVTVEVEGDHLAPIVWRDRLYLFWITFRDRANPEAKPSGTGKPANMDIDAIVSSVRAVVANKVIEAHLHWSEYVNGAWGTQQSTFADGFVTSVSMSFDRRSVAVHASLEDRVDPGVLIHLTTFNKAYYLSSPMAPPRRVIAEEAPRVPYAAIVSSASRYAANAPLQVVMITRTVTEDGKQKPSVLETLPIFNQQRRFTLVPLDNEIILGTPAFASLVAPVFYQDDTNTFFIEPSLTETTIEKWETFVLPPTKKKPDWEAPDWFDPKYIQPDVPRWKWPKPTDPDDLLWRQPFLEGPTVNPRTDWLTNPATLVTLGGELVGPQGRPEIGATRNFDVRAATEGRGQMTVVGAAGLTANLRDNVLAKDIGRFDATEFDAGKLGGGFNFGGFNFGGGNFGGGNFGG